MKRWPLAMIMAFITLALLALPARATVVGAGACPQCAPASAQTLAQQMLAQFRQRAAGHPQSLTDFHFANAAALAQVTLATPVPVWALPDSAAQRPPAELSAALEPLGWLFPMMTGATYHGFCYVEDLGDNRWRSGGTFSGSLAQALSIGLAQRLPAALASQRLSEVGPAQTFAIDTNWFILTPTNKGTMILPLGAFPPYWVADKLYPQAALASQFPRAFAAENTGQSPLPGPHTLPSTGSGLALIWLLALVPAAIPVAAFTWFVRRQRRRERLDRPDPADRQFAALWEIEQSGTVEDR
jgi:hypothetical protein